MKYILATLTALIFIGCGIEEEEIKKSYIYKYDMWEYRVSDNNITKRYTNRYYNDNIQIKEETDTYDTNETVTSDLVTVSTPDSNLTFQKLDDTIVSSITENRFVAMGGIFHDNCTIYKYHSIYTPTFDIEFKDILQVKCVEDTYTKYINYSKTYGNVGYLLNYNSGISLLRFSSIGKIKYDLDLNNSF